MNLLERDELCSLAISSDQQQEFLTDWSQDHFSKKSFYQKLYESIWWFCYQMLSEENEYLH